MNVLGLEEGEMSFVGLEEGLLGLEEGEMSLVGLEEGLLGLEEGETILVGLEEVDVILVGLEEGVEVEGFVVGHFDSPVTLRVGVKLL